MSTLNISLPEQMRQFIDEQVASGGYSTASEYVRELVRNAQKAAARARLESELLKGLEGEPIEVNEEYWRRTREKLQRQLQDRNEEATREDAA